MSLKIKYESLEDASRRLKGTVVLYDGRPVYIRGLSRGDAESPFRVLADHLPTKGKGGMFDPEEDRADLRKYISSRNFDIAPFAMGYLNTDKGAFFCQRSPLRMQQQGLSEQTFTALDFKGDSLSWREFLFCDNVNNMVAGVYPSVVDALQSDKPSVAFSRDFCLVKDDLFKELCFIYHRNKKVAMLVDGRVRIAERKVFLKESFEELGLRIF